MKMRRRIRVLLSRVVTVFFVTGPIIVFLLERYRWYNRPPDSQIMKELAMVDEVFQGTEGNKLTWVKNEFEMIGPAEIIYHDLEESDLQDYHGFDGPMPNNFPGNAMLPPFPENDKPMQPKSTSRSYRPKGIEESLHVIGPSSTNLVHIKRLSTHKTKSKQNKHEWTNHGVLKSNKERVRVGKRSHLSNDFKASDYVKSTDLKHLNQNNITTKETPLYPQYMTLQEFHRIRTAKQNKRQMLNRKKDALNHQQDQLR